MMKSKNTLVIFFLFSLHSFYGQTTNELIIRMKPDVVGSQIESEFSNLDLSLVRRLSERLNISLYSSATYLNEIDLQLLKNAKLIAAVQRNWAGISTRELVPNDPNVVNQWPLSKIDAFDAWDISIGDLNSNNEEIVIAVVDDGFDLSHEDISFWKNSIEIAGNGIDDDSNGYVDDFDGWNSITHSGTNTSGNHGTEMAGIVGAKGNNSVGIAGVSWSSKILPVVGMGNDAQVIESFSYILDMKLLYQTSNGVIGANIVVVNGSFGINPPQSYSDHALWCDMYTELGSAGILSVGAVANTNDNLDQDPDMPSVCPSDFLITVTATTETDELIDQAFPARHVANGVNSVDIAAPGDGILTTGVGSSYVGSAGTSPAAAHVSGVVGLLYSAACGDLIEMLNSEPGSAALTIKNHLLSNSEPKIGLFNQIGFGRLDAFRPLSRLNAQYDPDLTVAGIETETEIYEALNSISINEYSIEHEVDVLFSAGEQIVLDPNTIICPSMGNSVLISLEEEKYACATPFNPLLVDILNPDHSLCASGNVLISVNALVTGGKLPYHFLWHKKIVTSDTWLTYEVNSPNMAFASDEDFHIHVIVTDDRGITAEAFDFVNCIDGMMEEPDLNGTEASVPVNKIADFQQVTEIEQSQNIILRKNPSELEITVSSKEQPQIEIYDCNGKRLSLLQNIVPVGESSYSFRFDTSNLSNGIYFISCASNNNMRYLKFAQIK